MCGLGLVAGAHRGAAGAAGAADRHVLHQLRVPRRAHAAQVSTFIYVYFTFYPLLSIERTLS